MAAIELKGEYAEVAKLQSSHEASIFDLPHVTGVAIGHKQKGGNDTGDVSLTVFVDAKVDNALLAENELIPAKVGKFKTDVVETGVLTAGSIITLRKRVRPVEGGYSIGHFRITAGTVGCCVKDANPAVGVTQRYYILSNNHVLANSNNANIGDPVLQPGPADGGTNPNDIVARLARFVPINFAAGANNIVDCAIAQGDFDVLDREIYWNGYVNGMNLAPQLNMILRKTGRTTGNTTGRVTSINATVNVNFGAAGVARFVNQITTTAMSSPGDSGSLMLDEQNRAVGLLFAGSSVITIANPIGPVMSMLGVKFI